MSEAREATRRTLEHQAARRLRPLLAILYREQADECLEQVVAIMQRHAARIADRFAGARQGWDQRDTVLITYADQVQREGGTALAALGEFLDWAGLDEAISTIHLLPFFPFSSDDGFSVIDYRAVDPAAGSWSDVAALGQSFELMFDLVLNHCSQQSQWFADYQAGLAPYDEFFIEVEPDTDLTTVTRPRSLPLTTEFDTSRGPRQVWTTFSADQVDLNYGSPLVLVEMIDILLTYVDHGARIIRLDAVAYLWKEIGTSCIHLPQTHAVVKLLRAVLECVAEHVLLLTETNVPHAENVEYFGDGDEAHMVYQFSLPPLVLDAYLNRDARYLTRWLAELSPPPAGTTYFNFTASHDGVGVRPLEGLVPGERLAALVEAVAARGGMVSTRTGGDGTEMPYELNITYFDALSEPGHLDRESHVRRFLASQAVMLGLRGVPGIYFHSLIGMPNDVAAAQRENQPRQINRRKYQFEELQHALGDVSGAQRMVLDGYRRLLEVRCSQRAFHPDAPQRVFEFDDPTLFGFQRTSLSGDEHIAVVANLAGEDRVARLDAPGVRWGRDLLGQAEAMDNDQYRIPPYEIAWIEGGAE